MPSAEGEAEDNAPVADEFSVDEEVDEASTEEPGELVAEEPVALDEVTEDVTALVETDSDETSDVTTDESMDDVSEEERTPADTGEAYAEDEDEDASPRKDS